MFTAAPRKPGRLAACAAFALTMSFASSACALVSRSLSSAPLAIRAEAGIIPGSWDRVQQLQLGSPLIVTLKNGAQQEGAFDGLTQVALALTRGGQPLTIKRSDISRIVTRVEDKLTNGALTGAGVGLAAALAVLAAVGSGDGYVLPSAKWGAPALLSSLEPFSLVRSSNSLALWLVVANSSRPGATPQ